MRGAAVPRLTNRRVACAGRASATLDLVFGAMAQLVARLVRNEKVGGSNPPSSTGQWPPPLSGGHFSLERTPTVTIATQCDVDVRGMSVVNILLAAVARWFRLTTGQHRDSMGLRGTRTSANSLSGSRICVPCVSRIALWWLGLWSGCCVGVLFEVSIVCHVFYAMDALWLGLFVGLVVACLFCFGLPAVSAVVRACVACVWWWVWWVGWVMVFFHCCLWFCLESLILAQDERWRRA